MDEHSADRIRNASFSHAVRGYDRHEVDRFLAELADWLEAQGDDSTAELVRTELERVGEQTSSILTEAHDAAEAIRAGAEREVRQTLVDANLKSEALRSNAEEYGEDTREDADTYARKVRAEADAHAQRVRAEADEYAEQLRSEADGEAKHLRGELDGVVKERKAAAEQEAARIVKEANRRRRDTEAVISDLEERRDGVLDELEQLASGLAGTATQHRGSAGGEADEREAEATAARRSPAPE